LSAIKTGDLVVVVKPSLCCGNTKHLGTVVRVADVQHIDGRPCRYCGDDRSGLGAWDDDRVGWWDLPRLKRIPPLDELERDKIVEELTA
jgi:hypothetical protein